MMMKRLVSLALAGMAFVAGSALAASPTWQNYSWDIPLVFGDYIAVPGGDSTTLGALTISRTPDARGVTGGALYFYDADGKMVTQAINGTIAYNDDAAIAHGAPIATTPLTAYTLSNGPVRGGPPGNATATPTDDVISWEWTGPRAGTLTVNGKTQKMVHAWSGPPLVGEADYSGLWMVVARQVIDFSPPYRYNTSQQVFSVRMRRVPGLRNYVSVPYVPPVGGSPGWGEVALPPAGAALYDVTCASDDCAPDAGWLGALGWAFGGSSPTAPKETTLWVVSGGAGRALQVEVRGSQRIVTEGTCEQMRIYTDSARIVGRQRCTTSELKWPDVREFAMYPLGPDTLDPSWDLPRCESQDFTFGCNPFKTGYSDPRDQ